jgi:ABC-type dipeptide/oligopeptide/nickel transport system permease subunit
MVQQQITVDTFVNILVVVVWVAWAQFAACVLVEIKAAAEQARVHIARVCGHHSGE